MSRARHVWPVLGFLLGVALALPLGLYLGGGGTLMLVAPSPDGRERVELYRPTRWQRLLGHDRDDAVARVARADTGETLGVSPIFYASGMGPVAWRKGGVDLGMAASWDRASGRWQVQ